MGSGSVRKEPAVAVAPARRRRYWRWRYVVLCAAIAMLMLYLTRAAVLPPMARYLDVSEAPQQSDYVLVLGGGCDARPFVAAALIKAGMAKTVLVTRPKLSPGAEDNLVPPEHEITRRVLLARGVAPQAVVILPEECASTADEAGGLARFLESGPEVSVLIVTHAYHTRRARHIFAAALGERMVRVHFVATPTDGFDDSNWWQFERGLKTYTSEYAKLATSWLRP